MTNDTDRLVENYIQALEETAYNTPYEAAFMIRRLMAMVKKLARTSDHSEEIIRDAIKRLIDSSN